MFRLKNIYKSYKSTFKNYSVVLFFRVFKKNNIKVELNSGLICYWNYIKVKNYHYLYSKYLERASNCYISNLGVLDNNANAIEFKYKDNQIIYINT